MPELEADTNPAPRLPIRPVSRTVKESYNLFLTDILRDAGITVPEGSIVSGNLPASSGKMTITVITEEHG